MGSLQDMRRDYRGEPLDEHSAGPDPLALFGRWFEQAVESAGQARRHEPNAITLATSTPDGEVDARMVLLKHFDEAGFVFFTNTASHKGRQLAANPRAALVLYWPVIERQVRIRGPVEPVAPQLARAYFAQRPRRSQLAALASRQGQALPDRASLERRVAELEAQHPAGPVPPPDDWGGYRVIPQRIEFWQGRPDRLHDRLAYTRQADGSWTMQRLAP